MKSDAFDRPGTRKLIFSESPKPNQFEFRFGRKEKKLIKIKILFTKNARNVA